MVKYRRSWLMLNWISRTELTKLLLVSLSACALIATMIKPAQAAGTITKQWDAKICWASYMGGGGCIPMVNDTLTVPICLSLIRLKYPTFTYAAVLGSTCIMASQPNQNPSSGTLSVGTVDAKLVCPINSTATYWNYCDCNINFLPNSSATGCVRETFNITLNSPAGDLEPSGTAAGDANSSKAMSVLVKSAQTGLPKSGATVRITLDVADGSGGHDHPKDPNRPRGTLTGCAATANLSNNYDCATGADGKAAFTFAATQVSGTHTISASCISPACTNNPQTAVQDVRVPGLSPIPAAFPLYVLDESGVGGVVQPIGWTATHHDNHGATAAAQAGLLELAMQYHGTINPGASLYINDASLPWGGVFDICVNNSGYCGKDAQGNIINNPWTPPHSAHRKGDAIDIRAESSKTQPGEVPKSMFRDMLDYESKRGSKIEVQIHCYSGKTLFMAWPEHLNNPKYPPNKCDNFQNGRHFHVIFR